MGMARGGGSARVGNESQGPRAFPPGGLLDTGPGMRQVRAATFFQVSYCLSFSCHHSDKTPATLSQGHNPHPRLKEYSCLKSALQQRLRFAQLFVTALFIQIAGHYSRLHFHIIVDSRQGSTGVGELEPEPER